MRARPTHADRRDAAERQRAPFPPDTVAQLAVASPGMILRLQRAAGNQAVSTLNPIVVQRQEQSGGREPVPAADVPSVPVASFRPPQAPDPGTGVALTDRDNKRFAADPKPVKFYVKYHQMALADQGATGVPALVTLAQMAIESDWAMGDSASFFGVKGDPNAPPETIQWLPTRERVTERERVRNTYKNFAEFKESPPEKGADDYRVVLPFRRYSGIGEAIAGHSRALQAKAYTNAWTKTADPEEFAKAVAAAGYAGGDGSARTKYGAAIVSTIKGLNKAAAYARQHDMLSGEQMLVQARAMFDILNVDPSSQGIEQARQLLPRAISGYYVLSEDGIQPELLKLRDLLLSMGLPPGVAKAVCVR